jgi:hypothetical protein
MTVETIHGGPRIATSDGIFMVRRRPPTAAMGY